MRNWVTEHHFPDKVTVEEFFEILFDEEEKQGFIQNMKNLQVEEKQFPEEWAHIFIAWKEMNK